MKAILIPVSDQPESAMALHHGFAMGQRIKSSVIGCHIRPHQSSDKSFSHDSYDSILTADSYDLAWEAALATKDDDEDGVKAKTLFNKMAEQFNYETNRKASNTPVATWTEKVGSPERLFSIMGPVSDLIIVSRPNKRGPSLAQSFMLNAVLKSTSPVLVMPQTDVSAVGQRIGIAWNQSKEAMLAVKASLPLLICADEVNIITTGIEDRLGPNTNHLKKYLAYWGVKAKHEVVKGKNDHKAILKGFDKTESDLLVMGGYTRSRMRQRVFGGVTEHMLNDAKIPLFILHS